MSLDFSIYKFNEVPDTWDYPLEKAIPIGTEIEVREQLSSFFKTQWSDHGWGDSFYKGCSVEFFVGDKVYAPDKPVDNVHIVIRIGEGFEELLDHLTDMCEQQGWCLSNDMDGGFYSPTARP